MRKYEVHLPLNYGDGNPIEQEKIDSVREELVAEFGSLAEPYRRTWKYDGVKYLEILKLEIVTPNDKVPRKFLKDFKERLKESLRQRDILITSHRIQTV